MFMSCTPLLRLFSALLLKLVGGARIERAKAARHGTQAAAQLRGPVAAIGVPEAPLRVAYARKEPDRGIADYDKPSSLT
jgi:hypothetical protein